jgi:Mn-dependent DtxR family transcriptional regulator
MARIDKKFLAKLLDITESDISNIKGLTFDPANASEEVKTFRHLLSERRRKRIEALAEVLRAEDDLEQIPVDFTHSLHA